MSQPTAAVDSTPQHDKPSAPVQAIVVEDSNPAPASGPTQVAPTATVTPAETTQNQDMEVDSVQPSIASVPPPFVPVETPAVDSMDVDPPAGPAVPRPMAAPVADAPLPNSQTSPSQISLPKAKAKAKPKAPSKPKAKSKATAAATTPTPAESEDKMDVDAEPAPVAVFATPASDELLAAPVGESQETTSRDRRARAKRSYAEASEGEGADESFTPASEGESKKKRRKLTDEERAEREAERLAKQKVKEEETRVKEEARKKLLQEREDKKKLLEEEKAKRAEDKAKKDQERKEKEEEKERKKKEKEAEKLEKENEKKRQEEEAKKKLEKQSNFLNRFVKKAEPVVVAVAEAATSAASGPYSKVGSFFPFEPPASTQLAPINVASRSLSAEELGSFCSSLLSGDLISLEDARRRWIRLKRASYKTRKQAEDHRRARFEGKMDLSPLSEAAAQQLDAQSRRIRELALSHPIKLLKHWDNVRPEYHGTWSTRLSGISPRNFMKKDAALDYENDSEEEWEDIADAENLSGEEDEEPILVGEANKDEYSFDEEFLVADGYLSDGEGFESASSASDNENEIGASELGPLKPKSEDPSAPKRDTKELLERTKQNLKKRGGDSVVACIVGPVFDIAKLTAPSEIKFVSFFESHSIHMLVPTPYAIGEEDKFQTGATPGDKTNSERKGRKIKAVPEEQLAHLLKLTHGNIQGIDKIVAGFLEIFPQASKRQIRQKILECAKREKRDGWTKQAFFVNTELVAQYSLPTVTPPPPSPSPSKPRTPKDPNGTVPSPGGVFGATAAAQFDATGKPISGFFAPETPSPRSKPKVKQTASASRVAASSVEITPPPADPMVIDDGPDTLIAKPDPRSPTKLTPSKASE